jgi:ribosomal-protein-serine acetyltransferase
MSPTSQEGGVGAEDPEVPPSGDDRPSSRPGDDRVPGRADWLRSTPPATIELGELTLRRWQAADEGPLWEAIRASLPELEPWMPWAPGYDRARAREFLAAVPRLWAARSDLAYALVDADGTILGGHGLHRLDEPGTTTIGYWTATVHAGRGLATLGAAALTRAALALPEVTRVVIVHDRANVRSGAVPARLGYRRSPVGPAGGGSAGGGSADRPSEGRDEVRWELTAEGYADSPVPTVLATAAGS